MHVLEAGPVPAGYSGSDEIVASPVLDLRQGMHAVSRLPIAGAEDDGPDELPGLAFVRDGSSAPTGA